MKIGVFFGGTPMEEENVNTWEGDFTLDGSPLAGKRGGRCI